MGGKINVETQNDVGNRYTIQMVAIARMGADKRDNFGAEEQLKLNLMI
mgnify:FL=1